MNDDERAAIRAQVAGKLEVIDGGLTSAGRPRFRVTYADDIDEFVVKAWMIDDFLAVGEYSCFYGTPGSGKSLVLTTLACHVATATPVDGRDVIQGVVLYIASERANLVKRRIRAWCNETGHRSVPVVIVEGVTDLCTPDADIAQILEIGAAATAKFALPVVWVIIDTKAQVMGGANPNDDQEIMVLNGHVEGLKRSLPEAHFSIADHVPHSSPERMKGSGALAGAIDGSFLVRKEGKAHSIEIGPSKPPNDGPYDLRIDFTVKGVRIGQDFNGKPTFTGVLQFEQQSQPLFRPAAKVVLLHAGQKVMAAFGRLVDAGRTYPPPSVPGIRPGTRAVQLVELRNAAVDIGIFPEPKPPAEDTAAKTTWLSGARKAWERGIKEVEAKGLLRQEAGFAWEPYSQSRNDSGGAGDVLRSEP